MSEPELERVIKALRDVVRPHLERSDVARELASALGEWLIAEARRAEGASGPSPTGGTTESDAPEPAADPAPASAPAPAEPVVLHKTARRGIVPLKIGDATVHLSVEGATEDLGRARQAADTGDDDDEREIAPARQPIDLGLIVRRSTLKAASCRLFIERRAAMGDPEGERPILARMEAMIGEAKAMRDCFLWAFWRERPAPPDDTLRVIARCYDALAQATSLVERLDALGDRASRDDLASAMQLMASASSSLRVGLLDTWLTSPDADQEDSHVWLRRESFSRQIYIRRHMSLSDPADPREADALVRTIAEEAATLEAAAASRATVEQGLKRIDYHARRIADSDQQPDQHDLRKIADTIEHLSSRGVRESDPRYSDALRPCVAEHLLDHASPSVRAVVRAVLDRADDRASDEDAGAQTKAWSPRAIAVRELLEGGRVVIIGGEPRPDAIARIKDAFRLREVDWVRLSEHGTGEPMRAPIQRADTSLVLAIIKLAGHLHLEEARAYATEAGKPCVLLTGGYNPEQIADAVLQQASGRLQGPG